MAVGERTPKHLHPGSINGRDLHAFSEVTDMWPDFLGILKGASVAVRDRRGIRRSFDMAQSTHTGQERKSGEPAITHAIQVATFAITVGGTKNAVVIKAALGHDVPEDGIRRNDDGTIFKNQNGVMYFRGEEFHTDKEFRKLAEDFLKYELRPRTAKVIMAVTNRVIDGVEIPDKETAERIEQETLREAVKEYPEALVVKLADRLHYMRDIHEGVTLEGVIAKIIQTETFLLPLAREGGKPFSRARERLVKALEVEIERVKQEYGLVGEGEDLKVAATG